MDPDGFCIRAEYLSGWDVQEQQPQATDEINVDIKLIIWFLFIVYDVPYSSNNYSGRDNLFGYIIWFRSLDQ